MIIDHTNDAEFYAIRKNN